MVTNRAPVTGMTGARFGRVSRGDTGTDPGRTDPTDQLGQVDEPVPPPAGTEADDAPSVGTTGARFGRIDRHAPRADPRPPVPSGGLDPEPGGDLSPVGLTGARFGGPTRRRRHAARAATAPAPDPILEPAPGPASEPAAEPEPATEPATLPDDPEAAAPATAGRPRPSDSHTGLTDTGHTEDDGIERTVRVRPYVLTGGRTRSRLPLPLEALITSAPGPPPHVTGTHLAIVALCRAVQSVAEVSARLGLPLGVARVLVDDLAATRAVTVHRHRRDGVPDLALMERVLVGLHRL